MSRDSLHWFGLSGASAAQCVITERERTDDWAQRLSHARVADHGVYPVVIGEYRDTAIAVIQGVAPTYLRDALHFAHKHLACRRALFVGTGGSLTGSVGDFMVLTAAGDVDEERVVLRNQMAARCTNRQLRRVIHELATNKVTLGYEWSIGTAATVPGVSWESESRLSSLQNAGIDMVTMDTTHFIAACRAADIDGLAIQWATDAPLSGSFVWGNADPKLQKKLDSVRVAAWRALPEIALFSAWAMNG